MHKVFFDFTGTNLQIKWTDHDGTIPIDYLLENNFNKFKDKERHSWIRKPVSSNTMCFFLYLCQCQNRGGQHLLVNVEG